MPIKKYNNTKFSSYHQKSKSDKEILMGLPKNVSSVNWGWNTIKKITDHLNGLSEEQKTRNDRLSIAYSKDKLDPKYKSNFENINFSNFTNKIWTRGGGSSD